MKYLFSILFTLLSLLVVSQNVTDSGFTDKSEAKNQSVNGKKNGKWFEYIDMNGEIINLKNAIDLESLGEKAIGYRLTIYANGIPIGIIRDYHLDGTLGAVTPITDGKINGVKITYFTDGFIAEECPYSAGKKNGVDKKYNDTGTGILFNGNKRTYIKHPTVVLISEYPYTDGKVNGVARTYYDSGTLESEIPFTNDKLDGILKYYDQDGKLTRTEHYTRGSFHMGERIDYDKNGNKIK